MLSKTVASQNKIHLGFCSNLMHKEGSAPQCTHLGFNKNNPDSNAGSGAVEFKVNYLPFGNEEIIFSIFNIFRL